MAIAVRKVRVESKTVHIQAMKKWWNTFPGAVPGMFWVALGGIGLMAISKAIYARLTELDFKDKVVLITGGSRGLGLEMARILATKGAKLAICARTEEQLEAAVAEIRTMGANIIAIRADLTDPEQATNLIARVVAHYGRLDILINNAGVMLVAPENSLDISDYRKVMDSNLWSALYTMKAAIPQFRFQGEGRIANICSIGGKIAVPHMLPYSVSKFAMTGLSEGMAAELKKDNIHVTTVIPHLMRTGSPRNVSVKGDHQGEYTWFKTAGSLPLLSQDSRKAAEQIVAAIGSGVSELVLTPIGRAITALQGIAPEAITAGARLANHFLPQSLNSEVRKGYESESSSSEGFLTATTDEQAGKNNEL
jgi:NAD(P)-dependent dehydrogenase (short-subunit alcohol dehydrogenase family)